jgi:hypothetical protein
MPVGRVPAPGNLSLSDLANELSYQEQVNFTQLTALTSDPTAASQNLATYIIRTTPITNLAIVATGTSSPGTAITTNTTVYVSGAKTAVDVYRLPL